MLHLNTKNQIIKTELVSVGTLNAEPVKDAKKQADLETEAIADDGSHKKAESKHPVESQEVSEEFAFGWNGKFSGKAEVFSCEILY